MAKRTILFILLLALVLGLALPAAAESGPAELAYCLPFVARARRDGIRCEIYPDAAKMKKQMQYANQKQIPYVVLAGESEMAAESFTLKNMQTGEQAMLTPDELIARVQA